MPIDHDQIFKKLIEAFFQEFMALFCPDEAALMDFGRLEFVREEIFTDTVAGVSRRLDLTAKVGLRSGGERFVLVHGEFEASRGGRDFPRRMFRYHCQLFLRHDTEIVPIALFSDDARWKQPVPNHFELGVSGQRFVRFDYHLIKLRHLDYRQFLNSNNALAYALMAKMDYDRKQRVQLKAEFLRLILGCPIDAARRSLLIEFVETYVPLAGSEEREFEQIVRRDRKYEEVAEMITVYEEKGRKKGRQEDLILLLEKKFGELTAAQRQKIRQLKSDNQLDGLLLAVLDAQSLDELEL